MKFSRTPTHDDASDKGVVVRDERTFILETVEYIAQASRGLPVDRDASTGLAEPVFAWLDEAADDDARENRLYWLRSAFVHMSEAPHHEIGRWLAHAQALPAITRASRRCAEGAGSSGAARSRP